jgi:hypothetical protein
LGARLLDGREQCDAGYSVAQDRSRHVVHHADGKAQAWCHEATPARASVFIAINA